tara:strand:+ start:1670 stop:2194 length:525 start_codon:yes stop_codon:yes gene_type:complete
MKKIILIFLLFFFCSNNIYANNIVYLDIQYIIDNSEIGIFYKNKIKLVQDQNNSNLKNDEKEIKNKEIEINNQKNILSKDEIKKKVSNLNELIKKYQIKRNKYNGNVVELKKKYTSEIIKQLNPLLTQYVDKNDIKLVVDKKNILVGIKSLDVTKNILKILNEETKNKKLIDED